MPKTPSLSQLMEPPDTPGGFPETIGPALGGRDGLRLVGARIEAGRLIVVLVAVIELA
jgi:hypothetical protein